MANGNGRRIYRVSFVHETPRHECLAVIERLPCRLERFHKRARAVTISIKSKNVDEVLDVLRDHRLVTNIDRRKDEED